MLATLTVQDIVLIQRLGIDFDAGLTVLTGETGAGKSILLDSLSLALGARGDAGLVRSGAERGQVVAVFEVPDDHPVRRTLSDNGIDPDGAVILRRTQTSDGKTRAFVNDQPCSVSLLKAVGAQLVEIHGQHDDRALVDPEEHRRVLDAFGGLNAEVEEVGRRYRALRSLERELRELQSSLDEAEREGEFLRSAVAELEELSPEAGEEERLAERRQYLMRAEKIAGDLTEAYETIAGSSSPTPELVSVVRRLDRKAADLPGLLDETLAAINAALDRLDEARIGLEEAIRETEFDPRELEETETRLFALRAASRKYQVAVEALPALAAEYAAKLSDLDVGEERTVALGHAVAEARDAYREAARRLTVRRAEAGETLEAAVSAELPALKLDAARFIVAREVDEERETADGFDLVAFHVRTNPGTQAGPIMKVASGGELSRFLLALKVALADRGSAPTLVFDEIDTGVGGAVAEAIGRRLARLAERVQVLSVTHAPQVAARAGSHLVISKKLVGDGERVATDVIEVEGPERREEIARMLAGATISDEARAAAESLMRREDV
ncbi:DNA replication and repair protein RecN [Faunimonas pinastri]|uniref:DNA repair protein RecN n=1 Tax=Faunimonas pinastri TaxID=1855383 RepID=A0A1H9FPV5_9HYPH|nr:DNA repair protein RecN [Faunimonas pinastri]SEQ40030.1 DNA replication and repair protein RecN [Faunimonas pinastri]